MKTNNKQTNTRRNFIKQTASASAFMAIAPTLSYSIPTYIPNLFKNKLTYNGVKLGLITYSFRSLNDQSAEATLSYIKECGIKKIEMMGEPAEDFAGKPSSNYNRGLLYKLKKKERHNTLTEEEVRQLKDIKKQYASYKKQNRRWLEKASIKPYEKLREMYEAEGVSIYAYKPALFRKSNSDTEIRFGMRAAKALGASHVTLEHPSDDQHTLRLGKIAQQENIFVAYHGHTQQTLTFWDVALKQSTHNAMNIDIGHYVAAGNTEPLEILKNKHKHIKSMHVKDRTSPNRGQLNLPWGEGDTPIEEALRLMRDEKYDFLATIEYEYETPKNSDVLKEVKKCIAYCKNALDS